jgi:membrane-associated phospholipid phosphatase
MHSSMDTILGLAAGILCGLAIAYFVKRRRSQS